MDWLKTHFSFKLDFLTVALLAVSCAAFDLAIFEYIKPEWAASLGALDFIQAFIIIVGGITSWQLSRDPEYSPEWRSFWRWTVFCWLLVLGRLFNWGRLFFDPELPRYYFRIVCVVLIILWVLFFLVDKVYLRAWEMLRKARLPFWIIFIGISMFLFLDSVEHGRISFEEHLVEPLEESLEVAVFLSLLFMTIRLNWDTKRRLGVEGYQDEDDEKQERPPK